MAEDLSGREQGRLDRVQYLLPITMDPWIRIAVYEWVREGANNSDITHLIEYIYYVGKDIKFRALIDAPTKELYRCNLRTGT